MATLDILAENTVLTLLFPAKLDLAYSICFVVYFVAMYIEFTATIIFHYTGTVWNSFPPSNSRMAMHIRKCHQSRHGHSGGGVANG